MRSFTLKSFTLRAKGGGLSIFLVILFVLAVAGTFIFLQKTGRLADYKVNMFSSIGTDEVSLNKDLGINNNQEGLSIGATEPKEDQKGEKGNQGVQLPLIGDENLIIPAESAHREYKETASHGDSVTTLARRALKDYVEENWSGWKDLTSEHKIFIEDYIQKHIGDKGLKIGETIAISEDLVVEAINEARKLTPEQLENLKNFTELVWDPGF